MTNEEYKLAQWCINSINEIKGTLVVMRVEINIIEDVNKSLEMSDKVQDLLDQLKELEEMLEPYKL